MSFQKFCKSLENRDFPLSFPGHWVGGKWHPETKAPVIKESINPSRDEKLVDVRLDKETVTSALESCVQYHRTRRRSDIRARIEILRQFRQALADYQSQVVTALRMEAGKPAWEAELDVESDLAYLDHVCKQGPEIERALLAPLSVSQPQQEFQLLPVGVTLAFLPFSTPSHSFVQYFAAAVLADCPLLMVASSHAVLSGLVFAYIAELLELPSGMLNIVFGNFTFFRQALQDRRVMAVLYVGSREHCEMIRKESRGLMERQLLLQSGGKNAVIVDASADLERAVKCVLMGATKSSGQLCTSTSRVFVHKDHMAEFQEAITAAFRALVIAPTDADSLAPGMGPLYSRKAVEKFLRFQTMARREAAKSLLWGKALETDANGFFVTPGLHVMDAFDNSSAYQSNVLMSPDVAIYEFETLEDAIRQANTTDAPLVTSFIGDGELLRPLRDMVKAPNLFVNTPTVEIDAGMPVAGRQQCGHHRLTRIGLAFYLTYPQVMQVNGTFERLFRAWPMP